jgi:purine-cytosine permease-like protein
MMRTAAVVSLGIASIWLGAAMTLAAFDVWRLALPGGQKDFGEFILGGFLFAVSAGLATAWVRALIGPRRLTRRHSTR